ncbi:MAG: TlpA family protein disulfide reductase [Planctomycetota bacterium]|nr:MAG: TlpA family protein disulfide reductase [Planctomycetota bacterium]
MENLKIKPIITLVTFIILFTCGDADAAGAVGQKAPRLHITNWLTPDPPSSASLQGRVLVVEFWATWCTPCVKSIPHMVELTNKYADKGVLFIGISRDKSAGDVRTFLKQSDINYHIAMDTGISDNFSFRGIPTAFVIGSTGNLTWQGHPMNWNFETAIVAALEAAPPPFLDGVELGPFEDLRLRLSGGRDFLRAYRRLKIRARKQNSPDSKIATKIIETIDAKIQEQVKQADKLRETDPAEAFTLYRRIVKNFRGVETARSAVIAQDQLRKDEKVQKEFAAIKDMGKAEKLLTQCSACQTCTNFNPECKNCKRLNNMTLARVERILTNICNRHKDTKTANTARQRLTQLTEKTADTDTTSPAEKTKTQGQSE